MTSGETVRDTGGFVPKIACQDRVKVVSHRVKDGQSIGVKSRRKYQSVFKPSAITVSRYWYFEFVRFSQLNGSSGHTHRALYIPTY